MDIIKQIQINTRMVSLGFTNHEISQIYDQLKSWFAGSIRHQTAKGRIIELTFEEYCELFSNKRLQQIRDSIAKYGDAESLKKHEAYGFCLTWSKKGLSKTNIVSKDTMRILSRAFSILNGGLEKGEKMPDKTKAKISRKKKGVKQKKEHVEKRAEALRGKPKSEESNVKRRATMLAKKAALGQTK